MAPPPRRSDPGQAPVELPVAADTEHGFAACFARAYERFYRYAWGELNDEQPAVDAVQSTFAAVWQRYFLGAENRFVEVDRLAFRMLKLRLDTANRPPAPPKHSRSRITGWAARARRWLSPEAPTSEDGLEAVVDAALDDMRPRCREVFLLRREAGLTFRDMAALCGTDITSVSALMHRAQFVLREHVDRAGFGAAARREAADTGRWKIAEFSREPDLYESQEAIIEREGNPDSALISDYMVGELGPRKTKDVAQRLERDAEFREIAEPLLMAWSVPPKSRPLAEGELMRAWLRVRDLAKLPEVAQK